MQFAKENLLYWIWLIIPLFFVFYLLIKRKKKIIGNFAQENLLPNIVPKFSQRRLIVKSALLILVFISSVIALSRPQWGFEWQEIKREAVDIIIVVDTSKSMLAQDVKPNRLERTKLAVKDLLKKLKGDRVGLIAFSGDAFLICPLTVDYNGFLLSLNDLNVDTVPRGGTDLSKAISEAMKSYDKTPNKYKAVIIVTDGDNLEGDPIAVAKKAKEMGIKIYTVGIGTSEGELIQLKDENGQQEFLKDSNGNFVKSRLNEGLLQKISLLTGGVYVKSSGADFGLDLIYDKEISKFEKREIESKMGKRYYERFQIPLTIAILFLILETCINPGKK